MPDEILRLDELTPDHENARLHSEDNLDAIMNSLQQVGAFRSIGIDQDNIILAGNGVVEAARRLGFSHVRIVDNDDPDVLIAVRRRFDSERERLEAALADNRASDLSSFDRDLLATVLRVEPTVAQRYWSADELAYIFNTQQPPTGDVSPQLAGLEYRVVVTCESEDQQRALIERFSEEGLTCSALTS